MVLFMIINLLSGVNPGVVKADESPAKNYKNYGSVQGTADNEGISINKEVLAENGDGTFDVKLTVTGAEKITKKNKKTDIVLVVDTSGSMREPKVGDNYTNIRIDNAKEAATSFVNAMIKESGKGDIKIGLVSFASGAEKKSNLTDDKDSLNRAIQTLTANGGTYTQEGLKLANEILRGGDAEERVIVLISDGKPTFANGTHPNFGTKGENGYTRIDKYLVKTGYEIWHGETSGINGKWIGKGYDYSGEYGNYIVKLVTGKFGDGTESHHGQGAKSWPYNLMGDYFRNATISAADKIRNDKVKIYSVGIGLKEETADDNETKADKKLGRDVLEGIANNGNYLDAGDQAEGLNKILESLAVEIHHNKVINGTIVDPMSNYVEYVDDSAKITNSKNAKLEVPSNNNNNTLKISNINLGKDEKLEVVYKVKLKDNWKDGEFHPANGETTLTPTPNAKPMNFKVPEVRAEKETVTLTVNKKWIGKAPVGSVTFNIKVGNKVLNDTVVVTEDNSGNWTGKFDNLPRYKLGKAINYTVEEVQGNNYQLKGKIESKTDNNTGNITFTATNQNTEKVNITVTKKWVNTPDEFQTGVEVELWSRVEKEEFSKKTTGKIVKGKAEYTFSNLNKYDSNGNLIEYLVKEKDVDEKGNLNKGNHSFTVDVKQTEGNNYDWTITNTCDPINEMIKFTLVKEWNTVPDESVKPMFTIKATAGKYSSSSSITLPIKEKEGYYNTEKSDGGKTWTTQIQALKYYKNNIPIKYTIEEEKLNGYESTFNVPKEIGDNDTVTFTNKRIMRTLTLEKKWVGNPDNQAEFTLSGNGNEKITLSKNNWKEVKDLPVYSLDGNPIQYTITEKKIEGYNADLYTKSFNLVDDSKAPTNASVTFINTKMLDPKKPFTVHKTWIGKPAESVSFGLFADENSTPEETIKLTAGNAQAVADKKDVWTRTFTKELPEYKLVNGEVKKITYVVKELDENNPVKDNKVILEGRTYNVESNNGAGANTFNFTNTDITTGEITYTKVWKGEKSDGASFGLFISKAGELERVTKDNEKIPAASADENGKITFKDVDLANHSKDDYVVRELNKEGEPVEEKAAIELTKQAPAAGDSVVKKYEVTYDDAEKKITNTELIDITVKKTWGDNVPQSERKSVEVDIYAGNERKKTVELKEGKWEDTVTDLPYLPDGYTVKEVEINGIEVNNDLKKLYKVEGEMEKIKETSTINITNSFDLYENKEGKINVLKHWTVDPKNIKVKLYRKTAATTTESSKWVEAGTKELNGDTKVLKTAFDKVEGSEKYQILETAVGTDELTEDDIQNILSSKTESPIEYKIGEYEVTVHNLGNDTFFIKNTQDSTMKELVVKKKWSDNTLDKYKEAVQVQLYKVENNKLVPVEEPRYLNSSNWKTKFKGLRIKDAEGKNIDYRVAEVGVGNTIKTNLTLEDLQKSYKIGSSTVTIDGSDINAVVITNDVNLRDISVKKAWEGTATAGAVGITLYKKVGNELESVETKQLNSEGKWMTDFERQPKVDEEGVEIEYQIFETVIDGAKINIDPTKATGYKNDGQGNISYSTGTINDGSYSVVITGNSKDNNFVVKNSFTRNPVLPVIPGGNTPVIPGETPVIPPVAPTPNPSTPVVDVPDDSTPQGPSSPGNNSGEDGNTNGDEDDGDDGFEEIDEDEVPQDGNIDNTDDADDADDNNEEETTDIADNKAPKGTPKLPKTGGETGDFLSIIGLGLIGLGLVIRRRR